MHSDSVKWGPSQSFGLGTKRDGGRRIVPNILLSKYLDLSLSLRSRHSFALTKILSEGEDKKE